MQQLANTMSPDPGAYSDEFQGPPRWSGLAVTAFVLSLLGFLIVTAVLGFILGIAGIFVTGPGRRRGRGLAIAAIPISLVTGGLAAAIAYGSVTFLRMYETSRKATAAMSLSVEEVDKGAAEILGLGSKSFQSAVSQEQMAGWLGQVRRKHGSFVSLQRDLETDLMTPGSGGRPILNLSGKFTNGPALIRITFAADSLLRPHIDDIDVDGLSPRGTSDAGGAP